MDQISRKSEVITTVNGEQARRELALLEQSAQKYKVAMLEAQAASDDKAFAAAKKGFQSANKDIKAVQKSLFDVNTVLNNLSTSTPKELTAALAAMNRELSSGHIARGSKEWDQITLSMGKTRTQLASINKETQAGKTGFARAAEWVNKYSMLLLAAGAAMTGIIMKMNEYRQAGLDLENAAARLKALTGLDDTGIKWLTEQARKMSTSVTESGIRITQSAKDIVDAFTLVGSQKPELLKNKEALKQVTEQAIILSEASGIDLKTATQALTLSLNQYGASAKEAARYTNIMGAGAKEGAAEVDSQTQAIVKGGVAAAQAKVPFEALEGAIQTLAEFGIKDEIAGVGLKRFFVTLETGARNTRPSVVGLQKALENLEAQHMDASKIKAMFGLESYNVASVLIQNVDKFKTYTKAVTDTQVATEQARINTSTMTAKLAQAKNEMQLAGIELADHLGPAIFKVTTLSRDAIKAFAGIVDWMSKNKALVISVTTSIVAYTIAMKAKVFVDAINLETLKKNILFLNIKNAVTRLQVALTGVETEAQQALTVATKEANAAMAKNLWGLIIVAIGIAIGLIIEWVQHLHELNAEQKIENELANETKSLTEQNTNSIKNEQIALNSLVTAIIETNDNEELRAGLIKQLNERYPTFLSNLKKEEITNGALRSILMDVNEQYDLKLKNGELNAQSEALNNATVKAQERKLEIENRIQAFSGSNNPVTLHKIKAMKEEYDLLNKQIDSYQEKNIEIQKNIALTKQQSDYMNTSDYQKGQVKEFTDAYNNYKSLHEQYMKYGETDKASWAADQMAIAHDKIVTSQAEYEALLKKEKADKGGSTKNSISTGADAGTAKSEFQIIKDARDAFDAEMKNKATKAYLDGKTNEEQYNKALQDIEMKSAKFFLNIAEHGNNARLAVDKAFWENKERLAKNGAKNAIDAETKVLTLQLAGQKARIDRINKGRDAGMSNIDIIGNTAKSVNDENLDTGKISEPAHQSNEMALQVTLDQLRVNEEKKTLEELKNANITFGNEKAKLIEEQNKRVIAAENALNKSRTAIEKALHDGNEKTREQYFKEDVETRKRAELKALMEQYKAGRMTEVTYLQAVNAVIENYEDEKLKIRADYGVAKTKDLYNADLKNIENEVKLGLLTVKQGEAAKFKLKMDYGAKWAQQAQKFIGMGADDVSAYSDMENSMIEAKYQKQREAAQGNQVALAKIDQDEAQAKLNLQKQTADVDFAIKASEIIADTAVAIMIALKLGPIAGPIAAGLIGAKGVMELATANAEREKVKALTLNNQSGVRVVTGRESGGSFDVTRAQDGRTFNAGYDPAKRGYVNKPTVLVGESGREWVASHDAVNNSTIAPYINVIDMAQKSGNVSSFDMNRYFANHVAGLSGGGFLAIGNTLGVASAAQAAGKDSVSSDPELKELIASNNKLLLHLATEGIDASLVYTEWEKKVNLINKSRKLGTL